MNFTVWKTTLIMVIGGHCFPLAGDPPSRGHYLVAKIGVGASVQQTPNTFVVSSSRGYMQCGFFFLKIAKMAKQNTKKTKYKKLIHIVGGIVGSS